MNEFLKGLYKNKAVARQQLDNLKHWNIGTNVLNKTYHFATFKQAVTFMTLAANYSDQHKINANM
jgi:pterin-4a-carbinolamine dehydratase